MLRRSFFSVESLALIAFVFSCLANGTARSSRTAEDYAKFLEVLNSQGYGDVAVMYLERLEAAKRVPPELAEVMDLEKSDAYRNAAKHAYNEEQGQKLKAKAQQYLDAFLKKNPNHPAGAVASLSNADDELQKAFQKLFLAKAKKGEKEAPALMTEARTALTAVRALYAASNERFAGLMAKYKDSPLPKDRKLNAAEAKIKAERDKTEVGFVESRLKIGLIDYRTSETFTDPKSAERKKILQSAQSVFDGIYRTYGLESEVGLQAALWKGRTLQESGDKLTANNIYDEILVLEPEDKGPGSQATADFYSQVAIYRHQLLLEQNKADFAFEDATDWLEDHKRWNKFPEYQGMVLEMAKMMLAKADKLPATQRAKTLSEVNVMLKNAGKIESQYKSDIIMLGRQAAGGGDATKTANSFDELMVIAEDAASTDRWSDARGAFEKAVAFAKNVKNEKQAETAQKRLNEVKLVMAWADYKEDRKKEASEVANELMNGAVNDPLSIKGADLALAIAHGEYVQSRRDENEVAAKPEKTAAEAAQKKDELTKKQENVKTRLATLIELGKSILAKWPGKEEADEARVILGQMAFEANDYSGAYGYLKDVRTESKRFASTQQLMGQMFWKRYTEDKKAGTKPDLADDEKKKLETSAKTFRDNATKHFQTAVETQSKDVDKSEALPKNLAESRQILSQALLESDRVADAKQAVAPLIDDLIAHKPEQIDIGVLRTVNLAVKIALAADDADFAGKGIGLLAEIGVDRTDINGVLISFAKVLRKETEKATENAQEMTKSGDKNAAAADKKATALKGVELNLLNKLKERDQLNVGEMIYLADALSKVGQVEDARNFYKKIIDRADSDPQFGESAKKSLTRIRAAVVELLLAEGKFDAASKQADELIEQFPKSLEPLVLRARILQAWSNKDPKKVDDAIGQWSRIRTVLQNVPKKPPEYYEAVLSASNLLIVQANQTKDPKKAETAEKLLTATLRMTPEADGPRTVELYETRPRSGRGGTR
ncbi:MAG: hypothetical protein QM811_31685 [Pirellulales bacterium]